MNIKYFLFISGILLVSSCANMCPRSSNDRGLVMDQDQAVSRGGVANYIFRGQSSKVVEEKAPAPQMGEVVKTTPARTAPSVAVLKDNKIEISQAVTFDLGKSSITPTGKKVLDDVAAVIFENKSKIRSVRVEGHTDHIGTAEKNMSLSERRAASVKTYLVSKGVDASMLTSKGYGQTQPKYELGKASKADLAKNRRVEFVCEM